MEWIETTAKSVPEAKELALDKLGVDESEAEFEILEEPKAGLFGRVRGQARVRARIEPKTPRAKAERGDRRKPRSRKSSDESAPDTGSERAEADAAVNETEPAVAASPRPARAANADGGRTRRPPKAASEEAGSEEVRNSVEQFLTGLTAAFGVDAPVTLQVAEDEALEASIDGKHGLLLGPKGRTLDAIQELTRVAAQRNAPSSIRIRVDVGGYREARRAALVTFARSAAERSLNEGVEVVLEPMNAADRKVVHDSLGDMAGISTRSAGNDPRRRVIIVPENAGGEVNTADDSPGHPDEDDSTD